MNKSGRPRETASGGRHDYGGDESLSFWQRRWAADIAAQPERLRRETIERAARLLADPHCGRALRELAVCYGIEVE